MTTPDNLGRRVRRLERNLENMIRGARGQNLPNLRDLRDTALLKIGDGQGLLYERATGLFKPASLALATHTHTVPTAQGFATLGTWTTKDHLPRPVPYDSISTSGMIYDSATEEFIIVTGGYYRCEARVMFKIDTDLSTTVEDAVIGAYLYVNSTVADLDERWDIVQGIGNSNQFCLKVGIDLPLFPSDRVRVVTTVSTDLDGGAGDGDTQLVGSGYGFPGYSPNWFQVRLVA